MIFGDHIGLRPHAAGPPRIVLVGEGLVSGHLDVKFEDKKARREERSEERRGEERRGEERREKKRKKKKSQYNGFLSGVEGVPLFVLPHS